MREIFYLFETVLLLQRTDETKHSFLMDGPNTPSEPCENSSWSVLNIVNHTALLNSINTTDPQPLASVGGDTSHFGCKLVINQLGAGP